MIYYAVDNSKLASATVIWAKESDEVTENCNCKTDMKVELTNSISFRYNFLHRKSAAAEMHGTLGNENDIIQVQKTPQMEGKNESARER